MIFWTVLPVVPSDLICYTAGILRISFWRFLFALALGESVLVFTYIWLGQTFIEKISF